MDKKLAVFNVVARFISTHVCYAGPAIASCSPLHLGGLERGKSIWKSGSSKLSASRYCRRSYLYRAQPSEIMKYERHKRGPITPTQFPPTECKSSMISERRKVGGLSLCLKGIRTAIVCLLWSLTKNETKRVSPRERSRLQSGRRSPLPLSS